MSRQIDVKRFAKRRDLQKRSDAATTRDTGLLHVDRFRLQQVAHIIDRVFTGRDLHSGRLPNRRALRS